MITETEPAKPANAVEDDSPMSLASEYVTRHGKSQDGELVLRYWRGEFFRWRDKLGAYRPEIAEELNSRLWTFLAGLRVRQSRGKWVKYAPDATRVRHVAEAMKAQCQAFVEDMPAWLDTHRPRPADIIAFRNGLLDLSSDMITVKPPTPLWFSRTVLPYSYSLSARCPQWTAFLEEVFDGDVERVALLQEWCGYCLTTDTSQQKMLIICGPPRSGKGTLTRAMERLVGVENVANPTLSDLGRQFGLISLVGKSVAICGDAHLGRGADATHILETLKTIVGEDRRDIDRKNRDALSGVRIYSRFTIAVNELPRLDDASAALSPRLLILPMHNSYAGKEDRTLDKKLATETEGVMRWALEGLRRLRVNGVFTAPQASLDEMHEFKRLSSPLMAFVEDCLIKNPAQSSDVGIVYEAYRHWAQRSGHKPLALSAFGAKLHAAVPELRKSRPRSRDQKGDDKSRRNQYDGIEVKPEWVFVPDFGFGRS